MLLNRLLQTQWQKLSHLRELTVMGCRDGDVEERQHQPMRLKQLY